MRVLRNLLVHTAAVLLAAALFVVLASVLWPGTVLAPEDPDPAEQASYEIAVALDEFGASREGNYCSIFLGGPSVRPDRAVLIQVRHAEAEVRRSPYVSDVFREYGKGRLHAWMDMPTGTMYITNYYLALSRRERFAVQFHEVRGHWELRLSDTQMQAVLCPDNNSDDTHCITREVLRGCPSLKGKTTEQVYKIAIAAGPFLD